MHVQVYCGDYLWKCLNGGFFFLQKYLCKHELSPRLFFFFFFNETLGRLQPNLYFMPKNDPNDPFPNPNQMDIVPKPNQTISTALSQDETKNLS